MFLLRGRGEAPRQAHNLKAAGSSPARATILAISLFLGGCALFLSDCALHGPRHVSTVSLVSAHAVLSAVQDTEMLLVCDRPAAPPAGQCVPLEQHRQISAQLARAFALETAAAQLVRVLPDGSVAPTPQASEAMAEVSRVLAQVLGMIPESAAKHGLVRKLEPVR
jgi:hypothetical protein